MTQPAKTRRQMLEEFVAANPRDAFARYGLALECAHSGNHQDALSHFQQLRAEHPDYLALYYHFGLLLARLGRADEARTVLSDGIVVAQKAGDSHARDELQAALDDLKSSSR